METCLSQMVPPPPPQRPANPGPFAAYLFEHEVGEVLSKAVAATYLAQPDDAVGYLGEWLLRHVEDERRLAQLRREHAEREAALSAQREV